MRLKRHLQYNNTIYVTRYHFTSCQKYDTMHRSNSNNKICDLSSGKFASPLQTVNNTMGDIFTFQCKYSC